MENPFMPPVIGPCLAYTEQNPDQWLNINYFNRLENNHISKCKRLLRYSGASGFSDRHGIAGRPLPNAIKCRLPDGL
jgi:hypothetical protein